MTDYYEDDAVTDSAILAYHASRALKAQRIKLGLTLAAAAMRAQNEERVNDQQHQLPPGPTPPIYAEAERSQAWRPGPPEEWFGGQQHVLPINGDGPTGNGDADLAAAAAPRVPRQVVAARCVAAVENEGGPTQCHAAVWLHPATATWRHVDSNIVDHSALVLPDVHDRAMASENGTAGAPE